MSVLAVPRSIERSVENMPRRRLSIGEKQFHRAVGVCETASRFFIWKDAGTITVHDRFGKNWHRTFVTSSVWLAKPVRRRTRLTRRRQQGKFWYPTPFAQTQAGDPHGTGRKRRGQNRPSGTIAGDRRGKVRGRPAPVHHSGTDRTTASRPHRRHRAHGPPDGRRTAPAPRRGYRNQPA